MDTLMGTPNLLSKLLYENGQSFEHAGKSINRNIYHSSQGEISGEDEIVTCIDLKPYSAIFVRHIGRVSAELFG